MLVLRVFSVSWGRLGVSMALAGFGWTTAPGEDCDAGENESVTFGVVVLSPVDNETSFLTVLLDIQVLKMSSSCIGEKTGAEKGVFVLRSSFTGDEGFWISLLAELEFNFVEMFGVTHCLGISPVSIFSFSPLALS